MPAPGAPLLQEGAARMTRPLSLRLLGYFTVLSPEGATLPTRKAEALLAYLALPAGTPRPRAELAALLWGSRDERQARHSLNQALSSLRKLLAPLHPDLLQVDPLAVTLAADLVGTDVAVLEAGFADGTTAGLERAAAVYGGALLQAMDIREEVFEGWLAEERRRLREMALAASRGVFASRSAAGDPAAAIAAAHRVLAIDPLDEETQRQLIRLYADTGQRNLALRQYRDFAERLRQELDVAPEPETRALHQQVLRAQQRPAQAPPSRPAILPSSPPELQVRGFTASGSDPVGQAIADALRDDLVTLLTRRRSIRVRDGDGAGEAERSERGRCYRVEGSVRVGAAEITVTCRLVDGRDGGYLWSERVTGQPEQLLGPDVPLARRLAVAFLREIEVAEARTAAGSAGPDAWGHYHLALRELYRFSMPGLIAARDHLLRAVTLDPDFAAAYARLAYVHVQKYWYGPREDRETNLDRGHLTATQAVGLDPRDARGHFALGRLLALRREFDMAIPEFEQAIGLDPVFAQASFGLGQALAAAGQPASSVGMLDRAIDLDPYDPHLWTFYHDRAEAQFALGHLAEAAANSRAAVRLPNASHFAWTTLAAVLGAAGDREGAARAVHQLGLFRPGYTLEHARHELAHHTNRRFVADYLDGLQRAGVPAEPAEEAASGPDHLQANNF